MGLFPETINLFIFKFLRSSILTQTFSNRLHSTDKSVETGGTLLFLLNPPSKHFKAQPSDKNVKLIVYLTVSGPFFVFVGWNSKV